MNFQVNLQEETIFECHQHIPRPGKEADLCTAEKTEDDEQDLERNRQN